MAPTATQKRSASLSMRPENQKNYKQGSPAHNTKLPSNSPLVQNLWHCTDDYQPLT